MGHRWFWTGDYDGGVDPDFDDFGGTVTFKQICNPQFDLYGHPPAKPWVLTAAQREIIRQRDAEREALREAKWREDQDRRFKEAEFNRVKYYEAWRCVCCTPYNGHHTPNYWGTGQKDIW